MSKNTLTVQNPEHLTFFGSDAEYSFKTKKSWTKYKQFLALIQQLKTISKNDIQDSSFLTHSEIIYLGEVIINNFPFYLFSPENSYLLTLHLNRILEEGLIHSRRAIAAQFALKIIEASNLLYPATFDKAFQASNEQNSNLDF